MLSKTAGLIHALNLFTLNAFHSNKQAVWWYFPPAMPRSMAICNICKWNGIRNRPRYLLPTKNKSLSRIRFVSQNRVDRHSWKQAGTVILCTKHKHYCQSFNTERWKCPHPCAEVSERTALCMCSGRGYVEIMATGARSKAEVFGSVDPVNPIRVISTWFQYIRSVSKWYKTPAERGCLKKLT